MQEIKYRLVAVFYNNKYCTPWWWSSNARNM